MDTYTKISKQVSKVVTLGYSSSFGLSSKLFSKDIRDDIYAIYGLVRIADEVVDTYHASDSRQLLDALEAEVHAAIKRQYSTNPVVQSFAVVAKQYAIDTSLIKPFFASMRLDLEPQLYTSTLYRSYIHGSAEVIGLMCLKVFCQGNAALYSELQQGAAALGAAYQKVNFLRDIASDYAQLGRMYFPNIDFKTFSNQQKADIIADIEKDFVIAKQAIHQLPANSRAAVATSYVYYNALLQKLKTHDIADLKKQRIRIPNSRKLLLLCAAYVRHRSIG